MFIFFPFKGSVIIKQLKHRVYVAGHPSSNEYCLFNTFEAQCSHEELILITYARYGAMKVGKCIETEIGKCYPI